MATCTVAVLTFAKETQKWTPSGPGNGASRVTLYKHVDNNTYRIVGRNLNDKQASSTTILIDNDE